MTITETYTCPGCGAVSHNPDDVRYRYCGACHLTEDEHPGILMRLTIEHPRYAQRLTYSEVMAVMRDQATDPDSYRHRWDREFGMRSRLSSVASTPATLASTPADVGPRTRNPYWDIVREWPLAPALVPLSQDAYGVDELAAGVPFRFALCNTYSWSIPAPSDLAWLLRVLDGRPLLDLGAGRGYWAWQLDQCCVDVLAVDDRSWPYSSHWYPVTPADHTVLTAADPDRVLMMSWPPYDSPLLADALRLYRGEWFIYAADPRHCGDHAGNDLLADDWELVDTAPHHPTYNTLSDELSLYRRITR